jgi:hypothetical protein
MRAMGARRKFTRSGGRAGWIVNQGIRALRAEEKKTRGNEDH